MHVGEVVGDRFILTEKAGRGGMGAIFKAYDRLREDAVAIKLMHDDSSAGVRRFLREAEVLASFEHQHVVGHRGHGVSASGNPWLAMEWLDGEDLATRLQRGRLLVDETLSLIRGVVDALSIAHARGIVHRDIKPSNLFLVNRRPECVKILDFGIAGGIAGTARLTATNMILGTPGYMAPEQARGECDVGPPADIFSLGCVLYECLAGKPAFAGAHLMALLAKVLLADPPRLADERPDIPRFLLELCDRMMAKSPDERFPSGDALMQALTSMTTMLYTPTIEVRRSSGSFQISASESRLVSFIVVAPSTIPLSNASVDTSIASVESTKNIQQIIEARGASGHVLADGSLVVMFTTSGNPVDQAAQAAMCAFRLRNLLEGRLMVLVTGRSDASLRLPVDEVMDRAGELLAGLSANEKRIGIDDDTRALLEARYNIIASNEMYFLQGVGAVDESRVLLGKATPFVGRDRELTSLIEMVEEGFEEARSQAILVTAPAGMGKSRFRQEFLRRLRERHPRLFSEVGRADVLGNSAAYSLIAYMFRQALGIQVGEPFEVQQAKIAQTIRLVMNPEDAMRVTEFICELIGAPYPEEHSIRLRAARQDVQIMANQIEAAYVDMMRASVRQNPIVVVVEDLHWADAASFKLLDTALRELADEAFAVVAFARPEVKVRFPRLWQSRRLYEMVLNPLSRKAAIELARNVLGDEFDSARIASIVEHAAGNVFFLEELLRSVALGQEARLPQTVIGMVEARISVLDPMSRRVLRAASIFGVTFWASGVRTLLGDDAASLDDVLTKLVDQEFIQSSKTRRFAGEEEYVFRHALFREGAYAMLVDQDKQAGHALVGAWLEQVQEPDPFIIATHFELGGEQSRAARWYSNVAERALQGNDLTAALSAIDRSLALVADGPTAAKAWALRTGAAIWRRDYALALSSGEEALQRTRPGSVEHSIALFGVLPAAMVLRRREQLGQVLEALRHIEPDDAARTPFTRALATAVVMYCLTGQREPLAFYLGRMRALAELDPHHDPATTAWARFGEGFWHRFVERNHFAALQLDKLSDRYFDTVGDRQHATNTALDASLLGAFEEADRLFSDTLGRTPNAANALIARYCWALSQLERGNIEQAIALTRKTIEEGSAQGEFVVAITARLVLAEALTISGEIDAAEEVIGDLDVQTSALLVNHTHACGVRAKLLLARGKAQEAARLATQTIAHSREAGVYDFRHDALLLTHVEALMASSELNAARKSLADARDDLLARAQLIDDQHYRQCFLNNVVVHVRLLALANEWAGA